VKRTPLTRKTPLARGGRLRPYSARRRRRDASYPAARLEVFERSEGRCEAPAPHAADCTGACEQVHHREGRNVPDPHHLDNLVGLSAACHARAHLVPLWAYEAGISVRRHSGGAA
jgi:hypothetical protein